MKFYIFFLLFVSALSGAQSFYTEGYQLKIRYSKGNMSDGGDMPWYFYYCDKKSIYYCIEIDAHFRVAVPKGKIKVGDYWYFSGVKYLYAGNTKNNEMLIVSQSSEATLKVRPEACSSCLDVITIKNQSIITSILSIYSEELQKETSEWRYSEGDFYLNKIPKEFPSEQVYSVNEVEKRSKSDWVPD